MPNAEDIERMLSCSPNKDVFMYHELHKEYHFTQWELEVAVREKYMSQIGRGKYKIEEKLKIEFLLSKILDKIHKKAFEELLELLDRLLILNDINRSDYNCYLYLLGQIVELPEQYIVYINNMNLDDIKNNERSGYYSLYKDIFSLNIGFAMAYFNSNGVPERSFTLFDQIVCALLDAVRKETTKVLDELNIYLLEENYSAVQALLERRQKHHKISLYQQEISILINLIEAIKRFRIIPLAVEPETKGLAFYNLLMSGNFKQVVKVVKSSNHSYEYLGKAIWYSQNGSVLLRLISIIEENVQQLADDAYKKDEIILRCPVELIITFTDIADEILDGNRQAAFQKLHEFLEKKGKERYFNVIVDCFRWSIECEDYTFYSPLKALAILMSRENNISLENLNNHLADRPNKSKNYALVPTRKYTKKKKAD